MIEAGHSDALAYRALEPAATYRSREVSSLGLLELDGWRFKLYGISAPNRPMPGLGWLSAVRALARERLGGPDAHPERYGVGFAIVHHGREANFVLVDWWVGENMLENHAHVSPLDDPEKFEYATPTGLSACVWELAVVGFEREAWIETVLANPEGPDFEAYLGRRLTGRF